MPGMGADAALPVEGPIARAAEQTALETEPAGSGRNRGRKDRPREMSAQAQVVKEVTKGLARGGIVEPAQFIDETAGGMGGIQFQIVNPETGEFDPAIRIVSAEERAETQRRMAAGELPFAFDLETLTQADTDASGVAQAAGGIAQFVGAYAGIGKLFRVGSGFKAGMTQGAAADFLGFDGSDASITDMLLEMGVPDEMLPDFLEKDPTDPDYVGRFQAAVEGAGLGAVIEKGLIPILGLAFRAVKDKDVPVDAARQAIQQGKLMMQGALLKAGQNAELRMAERGTGTTLNMGGDPMALTDPLVAAAGRAVTPELNQVLNVMAEQMKVPPKDRVQPSGSGSIFELTPEAYERIEFEQKETPVPRAPEGKKLPLNNRGAALVDMSDRISDVLAERAKPYIGNNVQFFYHTGPLIEKAVALGIPENEARKQLKMFALNYAATSPRTQTEPNLKNASLVSAKQNAGIDVREIVGPGGEGINEKGYPMIINEGGLHLKLIGDAAGDGIDFNVNPKPATFAENVNGNLAGVTVDTHAIRAVLDAMNEIEPGSIPIEFIGGKTAAITKQNQAKYLADPSSFNAANMVKDTLSSQKIDGVSMQTEYAVFSDIYKMVAEKIGVQPAEAQSLSWFANGNKTGLGSAPKTIVELIEDRIDVTAQLLGQTKDEVFKKFMQGSVPLLSIGGGMALMETGTMQDSEAN
tara:strand:- start:385 stop:2469 length:2085 start_codon:yes stop_codon:yes gene_type:complete